MTPDQFKQIRRDAGMSTRECAAYLRIEDEGTIRRWENGTRKVSGPASKLMEQLDTNTRNSGEK